MSQQKYCEILRGSVALPDRSNCTMYEFAHAVKHAIKTEQEKINPDNALIDVLCNAARIGWELGEVMRVK